MRQATFEPLTHIFFCVWEETHTYTETTFKLYRESLQPEKCLTIYIYPLSKFGFLNIPNLTQQLKYVTDVLSLLQLLCHCFMFVGKQFTGSKPFYTVVIKLMIWYSNVILTNVSTLTLTSEISSVPNFRASGCQLVLLKGNKGKRQQNTLWSHFD